MARRTHRQTPTAAAAAKLGLMAVVLLLAVVATAVRTSVAAQLYLKDGRVLTGKLIPLSGVAENPMAADGSSKIRSIVMCDDGLRRSFVPKGRVKELAEGESGPSPEKFVIQHQPVANFGQRVTVVGQVRIVEPFDQYGRRTVEMQTGGGRVTIVQGITELTPTWAKVEALNTAARAYVWDQRIATTSIPHEVLDQILRQQIDPKQVEHRLKIVRFYLQMERYREARDELATVIKDFPEHAEQFGRVERELAQNYARRILSEIETYRGAGRHRLAYEMLGSFPTEGVAGETLQSVRQLSEQYQSELKQGEETLKKLDEQLALVENSQVRERVKVVLDEIRSEMNLNTLERMNAFRLSLDDTELQPEERLSLAVSGWLIGSNAGDRRLPISLSLFDVRNAIRSYLCEDTKIDRDEIVTGLLSQEAANTEMVARLVAHMKPPYELPRPIAPGLFELTVHVIDGEPPLTYYVQVPPEYDPYRQYPAILTLHGSGTTALDQIDWWAGQVVEDGSRFGQATRNGYIVVSPAWAREEQKGYQYSVYEHAAVLAALRDACRRFAIDTDRVFLTGHSMGGDAAWDLALAHPDLWAGVIPIVARVDKYALRYWEQARWVPFYLISGELDGNAMAANASSLDRYMTSKGGFDATVVEYLGRGHENFSDEILRLFDWMQRRRRTFFPRECTGLSMRPWDNFFWWVELGDLPAATMVDPTEWPPERGTIPATTEARINLNNSVSVKTGAGRVTLWLSPDAVDFNSRMNISINGSRLRLPSPFIEPSMNVLLEDVRTRGDRMHPFWAKVEFPSGRVNEVAER